MRWWENRSHQGDWKEKPHLLWDGRSRFPQPSWRNRGSCSLPDHLGGTETFHLNFPNSPLGQGQHRGPVGTRRAGPVTLLLPILVFIEFTQLKVALYTLCCRNALLLFPSEERGDQSSISGSPCWPEKDVLVNDPSLPSPFLPLSHGQFLTFQFF